MAEKVTQTEQNDLVTLMPNREIKLSGEIITIREYSFKDALTIHTEIEQFTGLIVSAMNGSNKLTMDEADSLIMNNLALVHQLASVSINKPLSFIESLTMTEGYELLDWWWVVNSSFFMNAVSRKIIRNNVVKAVPQNQ